MAAQLPATRPELDALKGNITAGARKGARDIRSRAAGISKTYQRGTNELAAADTARRQIANATAAREDAGMLSAAQNLGIAPVQLPSSRADRVRGSLLTQRAGDAKGWGSYFGTMGREAVGRNSAHAAAIEEQGRQMTGDLERAFQEYLASLAASGGGGGGGGGGRGGRGGRGNYWEDEPLVEYPTKVPSMEKGVVRGLAATSRRLTGQAAGLKQAGISGKEYADRIRAGLKKRAKSKK